MENFEESRKNPIINFGYDNANTYCGLGLRCLFSVTKACNDLPHGSDFDYYSTFKGFQRFMQNKGQPALSRMTSLNQIYNIREKFQGRPLEDKFELLQEINEFVSENISTWLDTASDLKKTDEELVLAVKPPVSINTSWNKKQYTPSTTSCALLSAKNIPRPQVAFKEKVDNSNSPFIPIIKDKPNSIKPLAITLERDNNKEEFCHPYEWELEKLTVSEDLLQEVEPIPPRPLDETPLVYVTTEEELKTMCKDLKQQKEIAVDLEHHSYRSFQGFTCLVQISTRETDYIIDALELRSELQLLNETFTDPKIIKVFHGADMDIVWLQRDFGVYVVNLFDTGQAARVLHLAHLSLSYLLKHYCKIDADKRFQLADWRLRPLPDEMLKYARQDTHYLLYIYDCIKNDLIRTGIETKNLLRSAFERSRIVSLKKYEKPLFDEDKYIEVYKKSKKMLNPKQLYCLKELYSWRDKVARENDESLAFVLPNHTMLQIAETLPREQQGVLALCNPIPTLVRQQLNEIHSIVLKASRCSAAQLAALEFQRKTHSIKSNYRADLRNVIFCVHDILDENEMHSSNSSNFTTLFPFNTEDTSVIISTKPPALSALFEDTEKKNKPEALTKVWKVLSKLYTPFQRYQMTKRLQADQERNSVATEKRSEAENSSNKSQPEISNGFSDEVVISDDEDAAPNLNMPSTSTTDNCSSTPLRKELSKKKKRKAEFDISLNVSPINKASPPKKSKTPEVVTVDDDDDDDFVPYDYSKTDLNSFSGKEKSKNSFEPGTSNSFKGPGKHHGRNKKHFRQGTFGNKNKQEKKKWPQNK